MKHTFIFIIISCFINFNAFSEESFDSWYNSMSDNEKVAQVFVTGLRNKSLSKKEKKMFSKWPIGGVIYFTRNYENPHQFLKLHKDILKTTKTNPFTFTDQEGGDVVRIGTAYDAPTPLAVGQLRSKKVTNYLGQAYGSLLADLGISANLAPVVDVRSKSSLDFISTRSFGSNAKNVAKMSLELSKGMLASGVIPTLKHFPGLGGVKADSHKELTLKESTLSKIRKKDWLPYKVHAKAKIPFFVMTSHTKLILDKKDYGLVTYSKEAVDLLRKQTSADQVAITDDLEMGGAKIDADFNAAAYKSFMAGHDLILIGWAGSKLTSSLELFKRKLKKEPAFEVRLKESLARIHKMRMKKKGLIKTASKFSKHKSLKLTSVLNSKISEYLLDKEVSKLISRTPATYTDYFYFSSDRFFRKSLKSKSQASLLSSSERFIGNTCGEQTCILHLTGKKTAKKINSLLRRGNNKNFIVLNSADPQLIEKDHSKDIRIINAYTRSYALSKQIQNLLEGKSTGNKKRRPGKVALFN